MRLRSDVKRVISLYMQGRKQLLDGFIPQLTGLRAALERCPVFATHCFVRSSILFVYDHATNKTALRMIDLSKPHAAGSDGSGAPIRLDHRTPYAEGSNSEDGYLTGLDTLIELCNELNAEARPGSIN